MYGEWMALLSALLWAGAVLAFEQAGKRFGPWQLNLFKGTLAILLLSLTTLALGPWPWEGVSWQQAGWLALSGFIGITLGDTAYFAALQRLGTRRTLLLGILSPPISALLGWLLLHETLSLTVLGGIGLTLFGVAWVIGETSATEPSRQVWLGVGYALLAVLGQAGGALITHAQLSTTPLDPLPTALLRLGAGTLGLLVWGLLLPRSQGKANGGIGSWRDPALQMACLGTFVGTYIAMLTYMAALKYAAVGVVQTLLTTSQIWGLGLAAWRGERITLRAVSGAVLALIGVALITLA